jgi:hypothetical protein
MRRKTLAAGAVVLAGVGLLGRRYLQDRTTPRVPYETVSRVGDVEVRRYPQTVLVETTASSEGAAFRRLFEYISGANESGTELSMTAPVESATEPGPGEAVPMTAPVESERVAGGAEAGDRRPVRMAFYLPATYDSESAPRPTDDAVSLVARPGRTLAVLPFSWWATDGRFERKAEDLRATLAGADGSFETVGAPVLMRYEGPFVPPFLRTNEVAVPLRRTESV